MGIEEGREKRASNFMKRHGVPPGAIRCKEGRGIRVPETEEFVIRVLVEPDGDTFHSYCPALKGLHSQGNTREEAFCNALEATYAYMSSVIKHGESIPEGITAPKDIIILRPVNGLGEPIPENRGGG